MRIRAVHQRDLAVSTFPEEADGLEGALVIVDGDPVERRAAAFTIHKDDGGPALRCLTHERCHVAARREDYPIYAAPEERPDQLPFSRGLITAGGHEEQVASRAHNLFDPLDGGGEKGERDLRDNHTDRQAAKSLWPGGPSVVVEHLGRDKHPTPALSPDRPRTMAQDVRHGREGHPRPSSHISHRCSHRTAAQSGLVRLGRRGIIVRTSVKSSSN